MKWIKKILEWLNRDPREELSLTDWIRHDPGFPHKHPKYRQTEHGFIEEKDKNDSKISNI